MLSWAPPSRRQSGITLFDDYEMLDRARAPSFTGMTHELDSSRTNRSASCDAYVMGTATPDQTTAPLEGEPPHPPKADGGGAVDLFNRAHIGLLLDWFIAGVFYATIAPLSQTLLGSFLGATSFQLDAATALNTIPGLFKFVVGYITDCVPLNRRRRKPYIVIGWGLFALFMVAMACVDLPAPDCESPDPRIPGIALAMVLGSSTHVLATAALEGVMIELAQREPERARGRTQCLCLVFRFSGQFVGTLALSLAFHSTEFGGSFASYVPIRVVFLCLGLLAACGVGVALLWLEEDKITRTTPRWATQMRQIWGVMQRRTTSLVAVVGFLMRVGTNFEVNEWLQIRAEWLHASPLSAIISDAALELGSAVAAALFLVWLRNVDWRATLAGSLLGALLVAPPINMIVTFDAWRGLGLFLFEHHTTALLDALRFVLRAVMVVEVVEPGYEALTYGLLTTVFNLGDTVMFTAQNAAAAHFHADATDLRSDSSLVRWHVAHQYVAKYGLWVATLLFVTPWMPHQKRHMREIARLAPPSLLAPAALFVVFSSLFCLSLTVTLLAMFETTCCLVVAGGRGC